MSVRKLTTLLCVFTILLVVGISSPQHKSRAQAGFNVVILVVDDFTGIRAEAVRGRSFRTDETCAVHIQGQGYVMRGAAADPSILDGPHGNVVKKQFEEMLTGFGSPTNIRLVQVDTSGLTTRAVAQSIRDTINNEPDVDFFVINMSFVLIPCVNAESLMALDAQLKNYQKTQDAQRAQSTVQQERAFIEQTVTPAVSQRFEATSGVTEVTPEMDPLQALFIELGSRAVPVASAGNFGLNYPFYPAAWEQVISVSASNGVGFNAASVWNQRDNTPLLTISTSPQARGGGAMQLVSNFGEIMLPGEFAYPNAGTVIGTSFAAPRLSLIMAQYLSNIGEGWCRQADGTPALAYREWQNLRLREASDLYCPSLVPYLPS